MKCPDRPWALVVDVAGTLLVVADADESYVLDTPCGVLYFDGRDTVHAESLMELASKVIRATIEEIELWTERAEELGYTRLASPRGVVDIPRLVEEARRRAARLRDILASIETGEARTRRLTRGDLEEEARRHARVEWL